MNFFDAQDNAKRTTRRLIIVYVISTILIVAGIALITGVALWNFTRTTASPGFSMEMLWRQQGDVMLIAAVLATLVIVGATFYKVAALSAGGGRVAQY